MPRWIAPNRGVKPLLQIGSSRSARASSRLGTIAVLSKRSPRANRTKKSPSDVIQNQRSTAKNSSTSDSEVVPPSLIGGAADRIGKSVH